MSASATLRNSFRVPFAHGDFRQAEAEESAARVRNIAGVLRRSGFTMAQLSHATGKRYGLGSPYFIPPTFLYKLRSGITPHICQLVALSESTGYRFADWMRMAGFELRNIPRLQMRLHFERTVEITPPEFRNTFHSLPAASDQLLIDHPLSRAHPLPLSRQNSREAGVRGEDLRREDAQCRERYSFVKIGSDDAAFSPQLVAGMIVRVDRRYRRLMDVAMTNLVSPHDLLWLVDRPGGLTCCRVEWVGDDQIILWPARPPLGSLPLRVPTEARVLGLAILDRASPQPGIQPFRTGAMNFEPPLPPSLRADRAEARLSDLLGTARRRTGLTFRAAHQLTRSIARILASPDYAIGLGALSDYEAVSRLPRHIAKIISLSITYCVDIRQLLDGAGVCVDDSDKMPLPELFGLADFDPDFIDGGEEYRTIGLGAAHLRSSMRLHRTSV